MLLGVQVTGVAQVKVMKEEKVSAAGGQGECQGVGVGKVMKEKVSAAGGQGEC